MKNIAIVTYHFYKTKTRGGEAYVELLTKLIKKIGKITVITTQSQSHFTWKNEIKKRKNYYQGVKIIRFPIDFEIKIKDITNFTHYLLKNKNHTVKEEILWMKKIGPYSKLLFNFLKNNKNNFDFFIFIGYANPITYFGLPLVKDKAFLIPLVHKEPRLYFKIFDKFFSQPKYILPSSYQEIKIIKKRFSHHSPLYLLGINPEEVNTTADFDIKKNYQLKNPYILFIGRTEPYKGIYNLIDYFNLFIKKTQKKIDLVIVGEKIFPLKTNKNIKYIGIISQQEKIALLKNSLFLVNPSWYESLSLTLLEAWQQKKPVLVYGFNPVLKDQVLRSKGGLFYETYQEFEEKVKLLSKDDDLRKSLGENGYLFYKKNYSQAVIEKKLKKIVNYFA